MPLLIGIVMQLSQQLSGINAVFYYSTQLFINSGVGEESAKYSTIGVGVVMVLMTLISIPLMDRMGRRTLQLYGLGEYNRKDIKLLITNSLFLLMNSLFFRWHVHLKHVFNDFSSISSNLKFKCYSMN